MPILGRFGYSNFPRLIVLILILNIFSSNSHAQGAGYWHTSGNQILDANNQPVRIAGINWYGFETTDFVAHGLWAQDYKFILTAIKTNGYNVIRIPFSNQMVESNPLPTAISFNNSSGAINSDLQGLHSLEILDKIISYAGSIGLRVILDNHRSEAGNSAEDNGLWYTSAYPESSWISDWQTLTTRYSGNTTVIGMDLRNEPHRRIPPTDQDTGGCWGCSDSTRDWRLAAQRAGNTVLSINPKLLIFVEGVDCVTDCINDRDWWGGNLEGVAQNPVILNTPNQLVYSAHDYGPLDFQQPWFNSSTTQASLEAKWNMFWGYIYAQNIAPVWVGEFGTGNNSSDVQDTAAGSQGQWFSGLTQYLHNNPWMNWTYWALNGDEPKHPLLDPNFDATPVSSLKQQTLAAIQFSLNSGTNCNGMSTAALNIWWPTDGSTQSGIQPFKARLESIPLTCYQMFWAVDGGQHNLMSNNTVGGDHKESSVDLSGWNWRDAGDRFGPFSVNFIAQDSSGALIQQKAITIYVAKPTLSTWWPTDGSTQSGTQPFKARLENMSLSSYVMYWSVDGGQLNLMSDNTTGGDHKEALVDLSGWTWRDAGTAWGPFSVSFFGKSPSGVTLQTKTITIYVSK
ncbi:MAG TPA: glycoside hydrolase family 5 protein [Candidatus Angelobacter sp.]